MSCLNSVLEASKCVASEFHCEDWFCVGMSPRWTVELITADYVTLKKIAK